MSHPVKPTPKRIVRGLAAVAGIVIGGALIERRFFAAPHYHGPLSDHFDGRAFHNLEPGRQRSGSFLKWRLTRRPPPWAEWYGGGGGPPPPGRVADLRVTFINHATLLIQIDGLNIFTDPIWSERPSPLTFLGPKRHRAPGVRFEDLPPIDAVLVSHNHYDHLDVPTLRRLRDRHRMPIVTPLGNAALLRRQGVLGVEELDWWEATSIAKRLRITVVPAKHFSARGLSDRDANLWGGFVISGRAGHVYFAGDTGWGGHFAQIARRFAPIRLALLPIGAYLPRWFMQQAHIDPAQAVEVHRIVGAQTSIAMHFGTFALGDDGPDDPVRALRQAISERSNPRFWILEQGEGRAIP